MEAFYLWFIRLSTLSLIALLIYYIKNPEKAYMFGQRWKYKEKPELSEMAKDFAKIQSIVGIIIFSIIFISTFLN